MPFVEPQSPYDSAPYQAAQFQDPQLGPPSEVTDLAGFEALIRKARQQPQAPAPVAASRAPASRGPTRRRCRRASPAS